MHKFTALWSQPDDEDGFLDHYENTHMEIVGNWPNVAEIRTTRFAGTPRGDASPFLLQTDVLFETADDMSEALQSEGGRESVNDVKHIVATYGSKPTLLLGEE